MSILVTGGAGYIGSHVVKQLLLEDKDIIVIDNFSTGFENTIEILQKIKRFDFINLDLNQFNKVEELFQKYSINIVIHFAAFSQVGESILYPTKYYMNNTVNTINLVNIASKYEVEKFIFSSTAAVYGEVKLTGNNYKINESLDTNPINPYGQSKLMSEQIIKDAAKVNKQFKYVILRYFNVAGADIHYKNRKLSPRIGELHNPETHLIPLVVKTALNKKQSITIYGEDYDTIDGTCIRDYIHVDDLADAHIQAISYLDVNNSDIFNCGYGKGFSVKQIIDNVINLGNYTFKIEKGERRNGDPSILVSDNTKIKRLMNWAPQYDNLELILESSLEWEKHV